MRRFRDFATRLGIVGEMLVFFAEHKWWWLLPMVTVLLLFAILMVSTQGSIIAPFVYALF